MSFFPVEVEPNVEVEVSEVVVRGELLLAEAIAVYDGAHASEPLGVVPHDAESSRSIEHYVLEREVVEDGELVLAQVAGGAFVAYGEGE